MADSLTQVRQAQDKIDAFRAALPALNGEWQSAYQNGDTPDDWPVPQPLTAKIDPEPYPVAALPDTIRAAVNEVADFVKAPVSLVASSALSALSLACQAHIDMKRAEKLSGPVSLFTLIIADSGERKTTCDGFFMSAIREYERMQAEAMQPELDAYKAKSDAWEAEREGLLSKIKADSKAGRATDSQRAELVQLQHEKPQRPRVPRLILSDETPENLAWRLAKYWPSSGIVSSEAGIVLGSYGMGKDSLMRNLAQFNTLWDGGELSIGRKTSESFTVRGARLSVGLMVQADTLRNFFEKSGTLARGTGFLARFLVAWPTSTQGFRPFTEAPPAWPSLAGFHRRIAAILGNPPPISEEGTLAPAMLTLTPDAKTAWIKYHDTIETELRNGGELHDIRDVAAKSADNAARLAALFQHFEYGAGGAVGLEAFQRASQIAAWHLSEALRFFGEMALPVELADSARLDTWLIEHCQRERAVYVNRRQAQRSGPLRDSKRLEAAITELADLDRLRQEVWGKQKRLFINPVLLGAA